MVHNYTFNACAVILIGIVLCCLVWPIERRLGHAGVRESAHASYRRLLLTQMLLAFKEFGELDMLDSPNGSDIPYNVPGKCASILIKAPDEGAVHVFKRPPNVSHNDHRDRVFAFFDGSTGL